MAYGPSDQKSGRPRARFGSFAAAHQAARQPTINTGGTLMRRAAGTNCCWKFVLTRPPETRFPVANGAPGRHQPQGPRREAPGRGGVPRAVT